MILHLHLHLDCILVSVPSACAYMLALLCLGSAALRHEHSTCCMHASSCLRFLQLAFAAAAAEAKPEPHPDSLLNHPTGQKPKGSSYDSEW